MTSIDYKSALFDVLKTLKTHYPQIAGGFARGTGGFDRDYILDELRKPASTLGVADREAIARALYLRRHPSDYSTNDSYKWRLAKSYAAEVKDFFADADAILALQSPPAKVG